MNSKTMLAFIGIMLLGAGLAMAISPANTGTEAERGRWAGITGAPGVGTEGGNITGVNANGSMLTDRWAAFYGNVTGNIRLTDINGISDVINWTWDISSGGKVCVSQNGSFPFALAQSTSASQIDSAFSFAAGSDQAVDTYTDSSQSIQFDGGSLISTTGVSTLGGGIKTNAVVGDGVETNMSNFAFCSMINATGTNYNSEPANYQVLVPTPDGASGPVTYYFFAEYN